MFLKNKEEQKMSPSIFKGFNVQTIFVRCYMIIRDKLEADYWSERWSVGKDANI